MSKTHEFSENYLNKGMSLPRRMPDEKDISQVFNGPILSYWLESGQALESELSDEQKKYAGLKDKPFIYPCTALRPVTFVQEKCKDCNCLAENS